MSRPASAVPGNMVQSAISLLLLQPGLAGQVSSVEPLKVIEGEDAQLLVAILELLPSGELSEERVAERLGMTPRTLYNRLRERAVPFRTLVSDLRRELAERYLADPSYSMTEIAFLLGYSDSSAFSRAFRGWHDMAPSAYRELMDGKVVEPE